MFTAGVPIPGVLKLLIDGVGVSNEAVSPLNLDALAQDLCVGHPAIGLALRHEEHLSPKNKNKKKQKKMRIIWHQKKKK